MSIKEVDEVTGKSTTGHEWDGIKELETPIPRVAIWAYAITICFAVLMWVLYPSFPYGADYMRGIIGSTSRVVVIDQVAVGAEQRAVFEQEILARDYDDLRADPAVRERHFASAQVLFNDNCAACHGRDLQGQEGYPNLVDGSWMFENTPEEIEATIAYGINNLHDAARYNEMSAYGRDGLLTRDEVFKVAEFVLSLSYAPHDAALAKAGGVIFAEQCASCHAEDGKGLGTGAPNLTDAAWIYGGSRKDILETLWNGRAGVMPSWEGRLSETEIRKLVLYVRWSGDEGKIQN